MSITDLTNAIVEGMNSGLEGFLEGTLAAVLPVIWLALLGLHLGRPYILDMIERFTLRLGADLLWLIYVGLRDFLIVSGVVMSFTLCPTSLVFSSILSQRVDHSRVPAISWLLATIRTGLLD